MSRNTIIVLICHYHKRVDLIKVWSLVNTCVILYVCSGYVLVLLRILM
jgi:hypothetical protein